MCGAYREDGWREDDYLFLDREPKTGRGEVWVRTVLVAVVAFVAGILVVGLWYDLERHPDVNQCNNTATCTGRHEPAAFDALVCMALAFLIFGVCLARDRVRQNARIARIEFLNAGVINMSAISSI
jgi:hypothetical protein